MKPAGTTFFGFSLLDGIQQPTHASTESQLTRVMYRPNARLHKLGPQYDSQLYVTSTAAHLSSTECAATLNQRIHSSSQ